MRKLHVFILFYLYFTRNLIEIKILFYNRDPTKVAYNHANKDANKTYNHANVCG